MNEKAFEEVLRISEDFFGTESDSEQIPVSKESAEKLYSIHPDSVLYKFEKESPIGWVVIVPTSIQTMNLFLEKKINERELLERAVKEKKFEALYLCGAFVLPEYRNMGYARELLLEGIQKLSSGKDLPLYCWIYSKEGEQLAISLSKLLGRKIINRER